MRNSVKTGGVAARLKKPDEKRPEPKPTPLHDSLALRASEDRETSEDLACSPLNSSMTCGPPLPPKNAAISEDIRFEIESLGIAKDSYEVCASYLREGISATLKKYIETKNDILQNLQNLKPTTFRPPLLTKPNTNKINDSKDKIIKSIDELHRLHSELIDSSKLIYSSKPREFKMGDDNYTIILFENLSLNTYFVVDDADSLLEYQTGGNNMIDLPQQILDEILMKIISNNSLIDQQNQIIYCNSFENVIELMQEIQKDYFGMMTSFSGLSNDKPEREKQISELKKEIATNAFDKFSKLFESKADDGFLKSYFLTTRLRIGKNHEIKLINGSNEDTQRLNDVLKYAIHNIIMPNISIQIGDLDADKKKQMVNKQLIQIVHLLSIDLNQLAHLFPNDSIFMPGKLDDALISKFIEDTTLGEKADTVRKEMLKSIQTLYETKPNKNLGSVLKHLENLPFQIDYQPLIKALDQLPNVRRKNDYLIPFDTMINLLKHFDTISKISSNGVKLRVLYEKNNNQHEELISEVKNLSPFLSTVLYPITIKNVAPIYAKNKNDILIESIKSKLEKRQTQNPLRKFWNTLTFLNQKILCEIKNLSFDGYSDKDRLIELLNNLDSSDGNSISEIISQVELEKKKQKTNVQKHVDKIKEGLKNNRFYFGFSENPIIFYKCVGNLENKHERLMFYYDDKTHKFMIYDNYDFKRINNRIYNLIFEKKGAVDLDCRIESINYRIEEYLRSSILSETVISWNLIIDKPKVSVKFGYHTYYSTYRNNGGNDIRIINLDFLHKINSYYVVFQLKDLPQNFTFNLDFINNILSGFCVMIYINNNGKYQANCWIYSGYGGEIMKKIVRYILENQLADYSYDLQKFYNDIRYELYNSIHYINGKLLVNKRTSFLNCISNEMKRVEKQRLEQQQAQSVLEQHAGNNGKIKLLGRYRKIVTIQRKKHVRYNNELIPLSQAKKLDYRLKRKI